MLPDSIAAYALFYAGFSIQPYLVDAKFRICFHLMAPYVPGLHVLATFAAPAPALRDMGGCQAFFDQQIQRFGLEKVGEAYHAFPPPGGFTAVLALTESHLSIHTWPEHGLATFDVFLSNFRRDNAPTVRALYAATLVFFGATELSLTELRR
jgi:S-adenosylmethionine decarboxylase